MMELYSAKYLNDVKIYYNKYIKGNAPLPDAPADGINIRPEIYASWKRSKSYGVDPEFITSHKASPQEFATILKDNAIFLNTAAPYIENIYAFVKGSNFVIHLTDKNGCLLRYFTDDQQIKGLFKNTSMLGEGSIRNEQISGTDSTSLCLYLDSPVQVIGAEHYLEQNHAFFCSSAPIHGPSGELLGILTIMGPREAYQSHTLGMACAVANGIELALQRMEKHQQLTTTNNLLTTVIDGFPSTIVTLDQNLDILNYNHRFIEMFRLPLRNYHGKTFFSIFQKDTFPKRLAAFDKTVSNVPCTVVTAYGVSLHVSATVKTIASNGQKSSDTLLIFDEQKEVNALAAKTNSLIATYTFDSIIGQSSSITEIKRLGKIAAHSASNVLILGESGTGKELLAQSIHNDSDRRNKPFVTINCGSIPKNLIESELFGYESGAFTGARQSGASGKFELAEGGTLFLDEIGDMPLELQASLLRVLQSHEVVRLGGKYPKRIDVRIIAATNIDLINAVNNKTFRIDLYYRLNVLNLLLPPLRERKDDIPPLVNEFISIYSAALRKEKCTISDEALQLLCQYDWPGNVRELENVIERAINIMTGTQIKQEDLPADIVMPVIPLPVDESPFDESSEQSYDGEALSPKIKEREAIIKFMRQEKGHVKSVAQRLDIPASTLYRKLKKYKINIKDFKNWY